MTASVSSIVRDDKGRFAKGNYFVNSDWSLPIIDSISDLHLKGIAVSTEEYTKNIRKASELIDSKIFRPPYGRISFKQKKLLQNDYEIIMWDVLTQDYDRNQTPEMILKNIKKYTRNGSIIVFHDSIKAIENAMAVLPKAIEFWKIEGYEFGLL